MRPTALLRFLASTPLAILLLAAPARGQDCQAFNADIDGDGAIDLVLRGTTKTQTLLIDLNPTSTIVSLDCNGNGSFTQPLLGDLDAVDFGMPKTFDIQLMDRITVTLLGTHSGISRAFGIRLGAAGSRTTFEGTGSLVGNSSMLVEVDGSLGSDLVVFKTPPVVDASQVLIRLEMGDGLDVLNLDTTGLVTNGSLVDVKYQPGGNPGFMTWNHSADVLGSTVAVDLRGSLATDYVTVNTAGQVGAGGRLVFDGFLGTGNDRYTQNLDLGSFDVLAGGEARFRVDGEPGGEIVTLTRNGTTGGAGTLLDGLFEFVLVGGQGNETVVVDLAGGGFEADGTLRLRLDGGLGSDKINVAAEVAAGSDPRLDLFLHGGHGGDTLTFALDNAGANLPANYGPAGAVLLDGGLLSNDACSATGNGLVHKRNCEK